jgi:hypothetical protein
MAGWGWGKAQDLVVLAGEAAGFGAREGIGGGESAGTRDPPLVVAWRRRELQRVGSSSAGGWGTGQSRPLARRRGRRLQAGAGAKMKMCRYTDGVYRRVVHALTRNNQMKMWARRAWLGGVWWLVEWW